MKKKKWFTGELFLFRTVNFLLDLRVPPPGCICRVCTGSRQGLVFKHNNGVYLFVFVCKHVII